MTDKTLTKAQRRALHAYATQAWTDEEWDNLCHAAPDMLAALKGFLLGTPSDAALAEVVGEDIIREARAAIAKAEGK
jgi:hypothetical protein